MIFSARVYNVVELFVLGFSHARILCDMDDGLSIAPGRRFYSYDDLFLRYCNSECPCLLSIFEIIRHC